MELFEEIQSSCGAESYQPLIAYLIAQKDGKVVPPYIPHWDIMPLPKLCKLALLWAEGGWKEEAGLLAQWLLQFASFLPLWSSEKEYREEEAKYWFSKISSISPVAGESPPFFYQLTQTKQMSSLFTLSGNGSSLGMIRAGNVEIRAMGPQSRTLDFGICGHGMDGWARCFGQPEVWLELKTEPKEGQCRIDLRFVGLKPEAPLSFAFYIKAAECQIEKNIFKPKSLRRFQGEAKSICFEGVTLEALTPHKMELIPLAGEGCFWDCEFLITFEICPIEPKASFAVISTQKERG